MTAVDERLTFAEHIHELRKRLMWSLLFVAIGAGIGYLLNDTILTLLQRPLNERLYYTTPTGAFSFIIKLCCAFGFVVALPVVVYQAFSFFGPLLKARTRRMFVGYVMTSVLLAGCGIAFAYFISLPAALHFLVNFGNNTGDIQALITADEYFNFVLAYIAGFAALFQLPLVISFINKATPLKPLQLLGGTRYVVLASFIIAAIITPTPDPMNQALMAGPVIGLFFLSVGIVALGNALKRDRRMERPVEVPQESIDAVLADEASLQVPEIAPQAQPAPMPVAPKPQPQQVVASVARPVQPRPRMAMDMIATPRRHAAAAPLAPARTAQPVRRVAESHVPQQLSRPRMQRVISDFIPATD